MKIIFLGRYNPSENLSGPEKVAKRLFENISLQNHNTIFIEYFFDGKEYTYIKKIFGAEKNHANGNTIIRLGLIKLFLFLVNEEPDIIHLVTFERFAFIAFIYKIFHNVKIVYTVHGIICYENNFLKRNISYLYKLKDKYFEKVVFKYSDKIIFLSNISLKFAQKYLKVEKGKVEIIPNGVDKCFYETKRLKEMSNNSPLKAVVVGDYFRKEKGLDFLINSLKNVQFHIELYVIGTLTNIYEHVNNINLKINCVDKLDQHEYANFLSDKDLIISSSFYDNFSISVVEGMAAGLVPIVTRETGMSELIQNGINGFIFDYGNSSVVLDLLRNLSRYKLKTISEKSKNIFTQISWENINYRYLKVYNSLIV